MAEGKREKVAVVGSGLVGKSWAMIFASHGFQVTMFDIDKKQVCRALSGIECELNKLEKDGLIRGQLPASAQLQLISGTDQLALCIKECVPENLELKQKVWREIDGLVPNDQVILASSSSCILPSLISKDLAHRSQFIIAHPVNPPYFLPMVELVPASWTAQSIQDKSRQLMLSVGQVPVSMKKELPGFVLNRLQYSLLNECWRLVASGVVSADDLDVVVKDGLGPRYAFMGPMETIHLNAEGLKAYCQTYGNTIYNVSSQFGPIPTAWKMDTPQDVQQVEDIFQQMVAKYPLDKLTERRLLRDKKLALLAKLKKDLEQEDVAAPE